MIDEGEIRENKWHGPYILNSRQVRMSIPAVLINNLFLNTVVVNATYIVKKINGGNEQKKSFSKIPQTRAQNTLGLFSLQTEECIRRMHNL